MTKNEWNLSRKSPIQLESGEVGCPYCNIPLVSGKVEMYYKEEPLGYFDGLKCKIRAGHRSSENAAYVELNVLMGGISD